MFIDYSKRAHTQEPPPPPHTHTSILTIQRLIYTALRLEMDEDSNMGQKTWQAYGFGKRNVFRLHPTESRLYITLQRQSNCIALHVRQI